MSQLYTILMLLSFTSSSSVLSVAVEENVALRDHLLQLQNTVTDVQSKSKIQEEKYAAVMSNIISKLTSTTVELDGVRTELMDTKAELNDTKTELQNLRMKHLSLITKFDGLVHKLQSQEESMLHIRTDLQSSNSGIQSVRSNLIQLENTCSHMKSDIRTMSNELDFLQTGLFFEGWVSGADATVQRDDVWRANSMKGYGLNTTTGCFTAPVSGYYLFWIQAFVAFPESDKKVIIRMKTDRRIIGYAYGAISSNNSTETPVHGQTVARLDAGSRVWFTPSVTVTLQKVFSIHGGALLQPFVKEQLLPSLN